MRFPVKDLKLELLLADSIWLRPLINLLLRQVQYLGALDYSAQLIEHNLVDEDFLANLLVRLVLAVVGVAQATVRHELKLEELVTELALVANVVSKVDAAFAELLFFVHCGPFGTTVGMLTGTALLWVLHVAIVSVVTSVSTVIPSAALARVSGLG